MSSLAYFDGARRRASAFFCRAPSRSDALHAWRTGQILSDRETFIHATRFVAALIVAGAHLRGLMFVDYKEVTAPPLWFAGLTTLSGLAGDAVMVFFVLSGWLVGGGLLNARPRPHLYRDYTIARITRLWTVLLPLFLLQALLRPADLTELLGPNGALTLLGNLLGLQNVYVPLFANNFPLWSLANETAYYATFALLVAALDRNLPGMTRAACLILLCVYAAILTPSIRNYALVWLIGALATRVPISTLRINVRFATFFASAILFAALVLFKRYNQVNHIGYDIATSLSFALTLVLLPASGKSDQRKLAPRLAAFSFSLYVVHVPIIMSFDLPAAARVDVSFPRFAEFLVRLVAILLAALLYAHIFEKRYCAIRDWLVAFLSRPAHMAVGDAFLARRDEQKQNTPLSPHFPGAST